MDGSGHGSSHRSGYRLTHNFLKSHRLSQEGSLISSGKSQFRSRCSITRTRGPVVSINKLIVLVSIRPNYLLKVQIIRFRDQIQVHVLCLEAKSRYNLILIQGPYLKCRAGGPSHRKIQAREMLRLEEPIIGQYLEEILLVITVQLNILYRKIRQFSGRQLILNLIQNLKFRSIYNKNQGRQNFRTRCSHISVRQDLGEQR